MKLDITGTNELRVYGYRNYLRVKRECENSKCVLNKQYRYLGHLLILKPAFAAML